MDIISLQQSPLAIGLLANLAAMNDRSYRRSHRTLLAFLAIGALYSAWFQYRQTLFGHRTLDGTFNVIFGLYICSRPAANAIDVFFYERLGLYPLVTQWSNIQWLAVNMLTLLSGWFIIYLGATHLTDRLG